MAMLVTKLETSRDILLPKVKDRLCLLKIDRTIQTDFGIQLNVVLFYFSLKKKLNLAALKCHHDQLPPTYSPLISKLEILSSGHMMKMEDAHSCRARQGPRLGDYLVIDTCLNKVGFTTKSGLRWSFRGGEDKKPRGIGTACSLLENAQRYCISRKEEEKKGKSQARGI